VHVTQRASKFWPKRISASESKLHKPWLVEGWSKEAQWLQDPSKANEDNLSNVRWEASGRFGKKKGNT
jgi:hypothetical protein